MNTVFIYALIDPRTKQIRYVGKAFDIKQRIRQHWHEQTRTRKCNWISQLKKIGIRPEVEVLETFLDCENEEIWQDSERWWIAYLRFIGCPLTNLCSGGIGGNRMSEEAIRKLKAANKGKTVSTEVREKIRKTLTGRKLSLECRAKMSIARKGKVLSPEHREKIRRAKIGIPMSKEACLAMSVGSIGKRTGKRGPRPDWVRKKLSIAANRYYENRKHASP